MRSSAPLGASLFAGCIPVGALAELWSLLLSHKRRARCPLASLESDRGEQRPDAPLRGRQSLSVDRRVGPFGLKTRAGFDNAAQRPGPIDSGEPANVR